MSLLPKNEPKKAKVSPKNYFIWGETMSGKTYLATRFPNPVILNTDGNAEKIETPSLNITNTDHLFKVVEELASGRHSFQTVIIDVVDDIINLIEREIVDKHGVESLGDIGFGKGYAEQKSKFTRLTLALKQLPLNVIYISYYAERADGDNVVPIPSLPQKWVNVVNGNCDLNIRTQKIGKNYIARTIARREAYKRDQVEDEHIRSILDDVQGVFDKMTLTDANKAKEIAKREEAKEESAAVKANESKEEKEPENIKTTGRPTPKITPKNRAGQGNES